MVTATATTRAREHIAALCRAAADVPTEPAALRVAILDDLRDAIGFDAHVWVMTDPVTCVGSAPVAQIPTLRDLPRTIRSKYLTTINRWTALVSASSLGERRAQSPLWTDVLSGDDIGDVVSSVFADRFGCWAFLDLWRLERSGPFDDTDCAFLDSIAEPVTTALRRCVAATFLAPAVARPRTLGPLVLILDNALTVVSQTVASEEWLTNLLPAPPGRSPIPAIAYNVAGQLLAQETGVDGHRPTARVHLGEGFWVTVRAARISGASIAVTLEESSPADRLDLYARSCGLSARETELLSHLACGLDTRQIAERMTVSVNTVQDHLKSVFSKTGTRSRTMLLGTAVGFADAAQRSGHDG